MISAVFNYMRASSMVSNLEAQTLRNSQALSALTFGASQMGANGDMSQIKTLAAQEKSLMMQNQTNQIMLSIYNQLAESYKQLVDKKIKESKVSFGLDYKA